MENSFMGFNSKWVAKERREKYTDMFFKELGRVIKKETVDFSKVFYVELEPKINADELVVRWEKFMEVEFEH